MSPFASAYRGHAAVDVVEDDLDLRLLLLAGAGALVEHVQPLLRAQRLEVVGEHQLDGEEEVALAAAIAAHDDVVLRREVVDLRQLRVAAEAVDVDLKEVGWHRAS